MESFHSRGQSNKMLYYYHICDIGLRDVCVRLPVQSLFTDIYRKRSPSKIYYLFILVFDVVEPSAMKPSPFIAPWSEKVPFWIIFPLLHPQWSNRPNIVSEHGLVCNGFCGFRTNRKIIKNGTVSDHGTSNGEYFIEIGRVVSEHGLVC